MDLWLKENLDRLTTALVPCSNCPAMSSANTVRQINLPGQKAVTDVLEKIIGVLFPGCHGHQPVSHETCAAVLHETLEKIALSLRDQIRRVMVYQCLHDACTNCGSCETESKTAALRLLEALPGIRDMLQDDIQAAYEGDPAARSMMEVVMSYPGLYAVAVHRVAHALYQLKVPLIPRVMGEYAHSRTGIDIHPGAVIGPGFFIDHGTGVVIGETCVIGRRVKLYQGVTLGALSFAKDEEGRLVKGVKRHPDVEDNVVIYAGATILGGETVIGRGAVIGGNVWLTHSVPAGAKVYNQQPQPVIRIEG